MFGWRHTLFITFICLMLSPISLMADSIAKLRGDQILYNETFSQLIASSNASLVHKDFEIYAKKLIVNTKINTIVGEGDILIKKDNQDIHSDSFYMDLDNNKMEFGKLNITMTASNSTENIIIHAESLKEYDGYKVGTRGFLTTCNYSDPHYFMKAKTFTLYPNERVVGQHVIIDNPIWFIPFKFWMPMYVFELGTREVVYLWPKFGTNKTEGTWYKSQFDYYFAEDNWGTAYLDYMTRKGVAMGIRHHYKAYPKGTRKPFSSTSNDTNYLYYYSVLNEDIETIEWKQDTELSDNLLSEHTIHTSKVHNTGNEVRAFKDSQKLAFTYDTIGDKNSRYQTISTEHSVNGNSSPNAKNARNFSIELKDFYQGKQQWRAYLKQNKPTSQLKQEVIQLNESHTVIGNFNLSNSINYDKQEQSVTKEFDKKLKTVTTISKTFDDIGSMNTVVDLTFDPDGDEFIDDKEKTWVEKRPETTFNFNSRNLGSLGIPNLTFNETISYGFYRESYIVPRLGEVTQEGSRYTFSETATLTFSTIPGLKTLSFNSTYNQYHYSHGDQSYKLTFGTNASTDWFSFLQTNTGYSRTFVPQDANSPFKFDLSQTNPQSLERVTETITLYQVSPSKYSWSFTSGYNLKQEKKDNLQTKLTINPNSTWNFYGNTTYQWEQEKYTILSGNINYTPSRTTSFTNSYQWDLNEGFLKQITNTIKYSWTNSWSVEGIFNYIRKTKEHQLDTLKFVKELHCRKFIIQWNKAREEYTFSYSINAFPNDRIDILNDKKGKTEVKVQGITQEGDTGVSRP